MHGIFIAFGDIAKRISNEEVWRWNKSPKNTKMETLSTPNYFVAALKPEEAAEGSSFACSDDRKWVIFVDGYIILKPTVAAALYGNHLRMLLEAIKENGIEDALSLIASGSFNATVIDTENDTYYVFNDRIGSIPLYRAQTATGILLSTNPVALITSGLFLHEIDYTACAEFVFIGYPIGSRFFSKGVKVFPPASMLRWEKGERPMSTVHTALKHLPLPETSTPGEIVDKLAGSIRAALERISHEPERFAHLQSAGMDSRLILAAWPDNHPVPCYTYGNHNSYEAMVAKSIAEVKKSAFNYFRPSGDRIAENLDTMFYRSGMMVYPDRFTIAEKIYKDGYTAVLDGFLGGALAGFYYTFDQHIFPNTYLRLFLIFKDQKISKIGLERLADILYNEMSIKDSSLVFDYFDHGIASQLEAQKDDIKHDIYEELKIHAPKDDSVALLFRNVKIANRAIHAIAMQGVMSRQFVQVYLPFSGDLAYNDLVFNLDPKHTAYKKAYISLFKKHFPAYAELFYGHSKLPLKRSALAHKWASRLNKKNLKIPYLTGNDFGLNESPNNWDSWLKESSLLREKAISYFNLGGSGNEKKLNQIFKDIEEGRKTGSGKIFHLAGIANWMNL